MHSSRMRTARTLPYGGFPDRDPPGQRPPWTETPLDRDTPGQRPPWTKNPVPNDNSEANSCGIAIRPIAFKRKQNLR